MSSIYNSTLAASTYGETLTNIGDAFPSYNAIDKLWAAWYTWMQNDVLATGLMIFVIHEFFYFGRCVPWLIIDCIPYFHKYKIQQGKVNSWKDQWQCTSAVLLSHFTVELPQIWVFHPICSYFGMAYDTPLPNFLTMFYQIALFFCMEDTWHYWNHRLMHYGPFYKYIHKQHHLYSAPFGLAAEYASPIEVMVLGLGTVGSPILWCALTHNLHIFTCYLWIVLRLFQAVDAHSGYEFPWSLHHFLPFWAGADHHDDHHRYFIGNYASSFRWWDFLLDTEAGPKAKADRATREKNKAAAKLQAEISGASKKTE
ncbi:uncharacterized protein V2V93DRAFT_365529 [Kockiozyma suomiensis]|uniref:uncharacterized protein n=1 Tax=Kockiozyma suomiensis TaxID=1337062 RepID=UPI0033443227